MDLRALLFDVNGTLIDIETDEGMEEVYRAIGHFLIYQGIKLHRWEVRELYFQAVREQFDTSHETYPEFDVVAVWQKILERRAGDYTRLLPAGKLQHLPLFLAEMQRGISRKRLRLFPQVGDVLSQLKDHYALAVVSDAQSAYAIPELRMVGLHGYFDPIIISGDYGFRKPDARLFRTALERLQVSPDQAVFIGNDRYRDIFGAHQLGMRTILFNWGQSKGRSGDAEPDCNIHEFGELPQALDRFAVL